MQEQENRVGWKALWVGLIVAFIVGTIIIYFILKSSMNDITGSMLGSALGAPSNKDFATKLMFEWWGQALAVGLVAGLITALLNKKNALLDGIQTGLLVFCIISSFILFIGLLLTIAMTDSLATMGVGGLLGNTTEMWGDLLWWGLKYNYAYIVGGVLGGVIIHFVNGRKMTESGVTVNAVTGGMGSGQVPSSFMNDSLPPAVVQKNEEAKSAVQTSEVIASPVVESKPAAADLTGGVVESVSQTDSSTTGNMAPGTTSENGATRQV